MTKSKITPWRWLAFLQALVGTAGSLYFSYVLLLPACILCVCQRALMIGLLILTTAGIIKPRPNLVWYAGPLAIAGMAISFYNHLLQIGAAAEPDGLCSALSVSCADRLGWDGWFTRPLLSFIAFSIILIALILDQRSRQK